MSNLLKIEQTLDKKVDKIREELKNYVTDVATEKVDHLDNTISQLRALKNNLFRTITENTSPEDVKDILESEIEDYIRKLRDQRNSVLDQIQTMYNI